jgi:hypothetical protein
MHTTRVGTARHASMSWVTRCAMRAFAHPTSYPGSPNTFFARIPRWISFEPP